MYSSVNCSSPDFSASQHQALLGLMELSVSYGTLDALLALLASRLTRASNLEIIVLGLQDQGAGCILSTVWKGDRRSTKIQSASVDESASGWVWKNQRSLLVPDLETTSQLPPHLIESRKLGMRSLYAFPLTTPRRRLGSMGFASTVPVFQTREDILFLQHLAAMSALLIENANSRDRVTARASSVRDLPLIVGAITGGGNNPVNGHAQTDEGFAEFVGHSAALEKVRSQIRQVAATDTTVLILGETGSGKELVARAIHRLSPRAKNSFVHVNCSAIPTDLLESELFGHEQGAFTGAVNRKIGRLELADKGTLLLDEIGDLPIAIQPKLLRVLEGMEFERLGGIRSLKVNTRIIAATNQDLRNSMVKGNFRTDLFYRLNVFPIYVPPLRDRKSDIPELAHHFLSKYSKKSKKSIDTIADPVMEALVNWTWPGNIRELEHFIERCVILSDSSVLKVPLAELKSYTSPVSPRMSRALEREHILGVLGETGFVIGGAFGAANRLGMKRTTLYSRMKKLGITYDRLNR